MNNFKENLIILLKANKINFKVCVNNNICKDFNNSYLEIYRNKSKKYIVGFTNDYYLFYDIKKCFSFSSRNINHVINYLFSNNVKNKINSIHGEIFS